MVMTISYHIYAYVKLMAEKGQKGTSKDNLSNNLFSNKKKPILMPFR